MRAPDLDASVNQLRRLRLAERLHLAAFAWLVLLLLLAPVAVWHGVTCGGWFLLGVDVVSVPVTVWCCVLLGELY